MSCIGSNLLLTRLLPNRWYSPRSWFIYFHLYNSLRILFFCSFTLGTENKVASLFALVFYQSSWSSRLWFRNQKSHLLPIYSSTRVKVLHYNILGFMHLYSYKTFIIVYNLYGCIIILLGIMIFIKFVTPYTHLSTHPSTWLRSSP